MPESTLAPHLTTVSYASLPSFPLLFETYCTAFDDVSTFYAGDFTEASARKQKAAHVADHPRDRDTLVEVMLEQNTAWGLGEQTRGQIERLREPDAVAVVTGQQLGLFSGPLYTVYKTLTTVQLARELEQETGRPVVPVFWLEGEDHDFDEVTSVTLLRGNDPHVMHYTGQAAPGSGNLGPVGRLAFTDQIDDLIDQIDELLPPTDFKPDLMALVRSSYRPGVTFREAFARFMGALFSDLGLVFISPDHPRLKVLAAPLFRRELEDYTTTDERLRDVSAELEAGYHAQIQPRPLNLFLITESGRYALEPEGDGFRLRGIDRRYTRDELLSLLDEAPERFSPNVVLRPLMQDLLLPTAAYVAGPGEVSYFAQLKPIYEWAGLPMPVIYPRASVTLVESKVRKVLDRYRLEMGDLGGDLEAVFKSLVLDQMDIDLEAAFEAASRHVHTAVNEIKAVAAAVDKTLERSAEATRTALIKEFKRFEDRVVRAEKRNQEIVHDQLDKARVNLYPGGKLQERSLSILYILNKYGLDFPARALDWLVLDTTQHQVVDL